MKNLNKTNHGIDDEKLKISELRYRRLFETAQEGILLVDFNTGIILDVNKFLIDLLGYSKVDFLKKHFWEIGVFKDVAASKKNFSILRKKKYIRFENLPLETKKGKQINVEIIANSYQVGKDAIIQCNIRDITERKQIIKDLEDAKIATQNVLEDLQIEKENLAREKVKDDALLASIGEGLMATDEKGVIILINSAAESMLGWKNKDVEGKLFHEVVCIEEENGELLPIEKRPMSVTLKTGKPSVTDITVPLFYVRKNGTRFPVAVTVAPVILGGKIIGAIDVFRDITKEKKIEKMRMDFLSLASHQLRTPLSGTKWLIETMRRGVLGEMTQRQKDYLSQLYGINERMIRLVSDMLNVLRLESGVISIKQEVVSARKLYNDLILVAKLAAKEKGWIVLRNLLENKKDVMVKTDVQILRNILECFISNAINYSAQAQKVDLDVKEEKAFVVFSVKDSGIGIPKEEQMQITERFYRASNAKKIKPEGTGLGLYIASMLAGKIGGKISFKSKEGKGSTFYLHIPKQHANI